MTEEGKVPMLIIDGDYPAAHGALNVNRDLRQPIADVWAAEAGSQNMAMASLPEMRRGRIAAALVKVAVDTLRGDDPMGVRSDENAYALAQAQLAYYQILEARGEVRLLKTGTAFESHMRTWSQATDYANLPIGMVLGMEGADPILEVDQVHEWWEAGLRVISLGHYGVSAYAHGTGRPGGLLPGAEPLLREMESLGIILDMTHTSDEAFWQALDIFGGPVLASHTNCRALVPGERQFSDEQICAILKRGAVIGTSMDTWMLYPEGNPDWGASEWPSRRSRYPREAVTLEQVADHMDHINQLAGNSLHSAIGGDTDGQGGLDGAPHGIDSVADYQKIAAFLERRGYAHDDISNMMHGNWQRFFQTWLPA